MSSIYVLQKEVPGLGNLTKIGMTVRSGEERANEYGGGGWVVVEEISVAVGDVAELKSLEGRIHDRLHNYRSTSAVGFGFTEVFTCSPEDAIAAARAEIGSKASDEDQVERLRKRTNRIVERKIVQTHAADLARLHMGKFEKVRRLDYYRDNVVPPFAPAEQIAEYRIHKSALDALDRIGAVATTFRAMVNTDIGNLTAKWAELLRQQEEAGRISMERSARVIVEQAAKKEREEREADEKAWKRELERNLILQQQKISEDWRLFCVGIVIILAMLASIFIGLLASRGLQDQAYLFVFLAIGVSAAMYAHFHLRWVRRKMAIIQRDFDAKRLERSGSPSQDALVRTQTG